ncbi:glycosyltransferase family 4 protein [Sphingomonas sp. NFX23]|uniref:glycosyltransferase family 4 protein n=1 Tax=Sphingomonas sp. NFX23 TaxID=2819532 RepID=UPI003CF0E6E1
MDIAFLPFLRVFWRRIYVIAHVSDTWQHLKVPYLRWITFFILRNMTRRVLIISENQRQVFFGLNTFKIHTILHPAFGGLAVPHDKARKDFVYVGRITREKGIFDLVDAWALLNQPKPRLRLFGQGSKEVLQKLAEEIRRKSLDGTITYEGPVSDPADLARIYRGALATIYPSYADAFPLVMLESISQETPCIISKIGEVPNFLGDDYPWLIVPGDLLGICAAVTAISSGVSAPVPRCLVEAARQYAQSAIIADFEHLDILSSTPT